MCAPFQAYKSSLLLPLNCAAKIGDITMPPMALAWTLISVHHSEVRSINMPPYRWEPRALPVHAVAEFEKPPSPPGRVPVAALTLLPKAGLRAACKSDG